MTATPRSRQKRARPARSGAPKRSAAPNSAAPRLSRRRFMTLLAAGSAALATMPGAALAAATPNKPAPPKTATTPPRPKLSAAALEDLKQQRATTRAAVEKIRAYPLGYGSDPAFTFRPIKAQRARR